MNENEVFATACSLADKFALIDGRRPRILIAGTTQDQQTGNIRSIAAGFADVGFDVDIGPLFKAPTQIAQQAAENDVHVVGIAGDATATAYESQIPQLVRALEETGRPDIIIMACGVPEHDHESLKNMGVTILTGPGATPAQAALDILSNMLTQ